MVPSSGIQGTHQTPCTTGSFALDPIEQTHNGWPRLPLETRVRMRVIQRGDHECWGWSGNTDRLGYSKITNNSGTTYAHRIVFEIVNGPIPPGYEIDHICRNRSCVNPKHLRLATHSENLRNTSTKSNTKSGLKGVSWHKAQRKWAARIMIHGKSISLGYFHDPNEAHRAYLKAASEIHGRFAAHLDQLDLRLAIPATLSGLPAEPAKASDAA